MRRAKWLLAQRYKERKAPIALKPQDKENKQADGKEEKDKDKKTETEAEQELDWSIQSPEDVFRVDNPTYERLLRPWAPPHDLQDLAGFFGCRWINDVTQRTIAPSGKQTQTARSAELQAHIQERLPLLVLNNRQQRLKSLREDAFMAVVR